VRKAELASDGPRPTPPTLRALTIIVFAEALAILAGCIVLIATFDPRINAASGLALIVTAAVFAVLVGVLGLGLLRRWRRVRGAVIVWQVLQISCGLISLQGLLGPWWAGLVLIVPAAAAFWLAMSQSVAEALLPDEA